MDYKNKTILPLVFLALALLFIWKIWPMLNSIREDKKEAQILSGENARLNGLLVKINALNSLYKKNENSVGKFSLILPDKDDKANLTAAFESLASANGLIIGKIIFFEPQEKEARVGKELKSDYETKIIELNLQGSYPSFKSFLKTLENNLRAMDVSSVSFASSSSASSAFPRSAPYIFNLKLKTYLANPVRNAISNGAKPINENNLLGEVSGSDIIDLSFVKEKKFSDLISLPDYSVKINKAADLNSKNIFAP
ncbi:hypothetical protein KJ575_00345 [Patescibacteria group bacterium]|nr:hypothetical protein [Patescibacteria group bacterium]